MGRPKRGPLSSLQLLSPAAVLRASLKLFEQAGTAYKGGDDGEQRRLVRLFRGVQRKLPRRVGGEVEQQRRVVPGGVAIVAAAVGGAACLVDGLNTRGERLLNIA